MSVARKHGLTALVAAHIFAAHVLTAHVFAADICLIRDGEPEARIVVPDDVSEALRVVSGQLAAYLKASAGAQVPVVEESKLKVDSPQPLLVIGQTRRWPVRFPEGFDEDGFVIEAKGHVVNICGVTDWGTEFGVYDFLERFVGVRWLLPGEHGTDVPRISTLNVPEGRVEDQPVFFSRFLSGLRGAPQEEWARHNRMRGRVSFHHNLNRLFPPGHYTRSHPHFFPMLDGRTRYLARDGDDQGWQPCLTAPGLVDEAVKNIVAYFRDNPSAPSYSLGMNDSGKFCACPECVKRISGRKNYLGWVDYSDLYYDWCNRVIEGVLQVYPDKWFGCLAYFNVATPPTKVNVHPRLVPFITYDRMKWIDPRLRAAGEDATRQWRRSVPTCAWYDYIYGTPYCLPRVYVHHAQQYLVFAADNGVKAHYAEIYPNFGEGPKPYVHLRLWWNPRQDVDKLLTEWYERCVGPAAAPYLAEYYAIWERFWTRDILQSDWFSMTSGTWLSFDDPSYLAAVKREDLAESRRLLEQTLAHCQTPEQHARARLLEQAFQYYEASALAYLAQPALSPPRTDTEADALATVERIVQGMTMTARRHRLALEVFPKDPVLVHPLDLNRYARVRGDAWGGAGLLAVADSVLRGDDAVRRRVQELAAGSEIPLIRRQAALLLAAVDGSTDVVNPNPSFEKGAGTAATGWTYWRTPDEGRLPPAGRMLRSRDVAQEGQYSLLCEAMLRGGPVATVAFPGPGTYLALAWAYAPEGQQSKGTVEVSATLLDEQGANLSRSRTSPIVPVAGKWSLVVLDMDIPDRVEGRKVAKVRVAPVVDSFHHDGGKVYFDAVELRRLRALTGESVPGRVPGVPPVSRGGT